MPLLISPPFPVAAVAVAAAAVAVVAAGAAGADAAAPAGAAAPVGAGVAAGRTLWLAAGALAVHAAAAVAAAAAVGLGREKAAGQVAELAGMLALVAARSTRSQPQRTAHRPSRRPRRWDPRTRPRAALGGSQGTLPRLHRRPGLGDTAGPPSRPAAGSSPPGSSRTQPARGSRPQAPGSTSTLLVRHREPPRRPPRSPSARHAACRTGGTPCGGQSCCSRKKRRASPRASCPGCRHGRGHQERLRVEPSAPGAPFQLEDFASLQERFEPMHHVGPHIYCTPSAEQSCYSHTCRKSSPPA
mmetsp:Transcript_10695/g.30689  ORF Transcript_10695/g.30689 Transcript_10695/m.30689 type:complete len:300 (+) Transcript_10695:2067-2966(+)